MGMGVTSDLSGPWSHGCPPSAHDPVVASTMVGARQAPGRITMSKYGLEVGSPDVKSVGSITFGPEGILFVADNVSATIFAIDVADEVTVTETRPVDVEDLD